MGNPDGPPPRAVNVSVVLELDNVRVSDQGRLFAACESVGRQVREVVDAGRTAEVIVAYDAAEVGDGLAQRARAALATAGGIDVCLLPAPGARYYALKNRGAVAACGEIVVFADSDAIPEPGWLAGLLRGIKGGASVAAGTTYIEPRGPYRTAFALTWLFPLRRSGDATWPTTGFWANNVAFRRDLFLAHRFPEDERFRGQCRTLAEALRRDGVEMVTVTAARTNHPPPNGIRHYVVRAMVTGHDEVLAGRPALATFASRMAHSTGRILRKRKAVGLPAWQTPGALAVAWGFQALALAGHVGTRLNRPFMERYLDV